MYYDMSDYNRIAGDGSVVHKATDQTIIVVYSPTMFRRRKKNGSHLYKGYIYLNCYPIELFEEYMRELKKVQKEVESVSDNLILDGVDKFLIPPFIELSNKLSYCWYFCYQRGKTEYFEYKDKKDLWSRKGYPAILKDDDLEWGAKSNWAALSSQQRTTALKNNRFIKKLISEYMLVRLSEE